MERVAGRVGIIREGRLVAMVEVTRLKAVYERRMEVVLRAPALVERFAGLDGVRVLAVAPDRRRVELAVHGEPGPLLRVLADLPVADLTFAPPDLEGIFLHYYGEGAPEPGAAAGTPVASTARAPLEVLR